MIWNLHEYWTFVFRASVWFQSVPVVAEEVKEVCNIPPAKGGRSMEILT